MGISQEHLQQAKEVFGTNKSYMFVNNLIKHGIQNNNLSYVNDPQLLDLAIQYNDGEAITSLLCAGCELTQRHIDFATSSATYEGRQPYAYEAVSSWVKLKDALSDVEILNRSNIVLSNPQMAEENKKIVLQQKELPSDAMIPFYHGTKGQLSESSLTFTSKMAETGYFEERSGPGLKCVSAEAGFWYGNGFKIEIPRNLVEFNGEKNPNAVVRVDEDGLTHVVTNNKKLKFDEFKSSFLVNIHPVYMVKQSQETVPSTYFPNQEGNFDSKFHEPEPNVKTLISEIVQKMNTHEMKRIASMESPKSEAPSIEPNTLDPLDISSKMMSMREKFLKQERSNSFTPN